VTVVDVRREASYDASQRRIPGSIRIPIDDLYARINEIPRDRPVVFSCSCPSEETSSRAAVILLDRGYTDVYALKGGWNAWVVAGYPIEQVMQLIRR
jgi:rhodanese-related sulfurtransferase